MMLGPNSVSVKKDLVTLCNARITAEITSTFTAILAATKLTDSNAATVSARSLIERASRFGRSIFPTKNCFAFSIVCRKAVAFAARPACAM